jgi:hypothetical protein
MESARFIQHFPVTLGKDYLSNTVELGLVVVNKRKHQMEFVEIELTQGNLNHDHLYLSSVIEFFPPDSIGGSNDSNLAPRALEVHSGIASPVRTDIAGDKKIFRRRAWVGEFFKVHNLAAGDRVIIEKTGADRYHVYPKRA